MRLPSPALFAVFVLVSIVTLQSFVRLAKAGEACPTNTIFCNDTHTSTAPALSISCTDYLFLNELTSSTEAFASYDLRSGMFHSSTSTGLSAGFRSLVLAQDIYQVIGNPSGIPLNFVATLRITASKTILSHACALLSGGTENQEKFCIGVGSFEIKISIPLEHVVGEPFPLLYQLWTDGIEGGDSSISAVLEFEGLPPGATITSCQGFIQEFPVPVQEETWGSIKVLYR